MRISPMEDERYLKPYTLKPTIFPEGFVLVQDTREQLPLFPRIPKGLIIASATLKDGDYSVRGLEDKIAFERKRISDLLPYCSIDKKDKTMRKMLRFKEIAQKGGFVGLIIEERESDVYKFHQHSSVHPEVLRGAIISFEVRFGVHVYFGDRQNCARWLLDRAVKFYNVAHEI